MSEQGISDEFRSKLDKLLDEFDSSNPDFIFCKDDFDPMEFCVSPALNKEEGNILRKFRRLIEIHGGMVKFNLGAGGHHIIKLVHNKMPSFYSEDDLFLAQFVIDSLEANKLQNLCDYRASKTKFPDVNPNHIMRGLKSWEDVKRKRDSQEEENANVVIDSSESEENMERGECSRNSKKPLKRRKQYYSIDEEREILNYIVKKRYFFRVKGNAIWKDMETKKVCGSRTWQSMKERYLNHIIPKIGQFNLSPKKKEKVLIPFRSNNVKISHDVFEEATTGNSNTETNERECVEDHDESNFGESSLDKGTKQAGQRKSDNEELENKQLNSEPAEPVSSASCGDNTHESKISESPAIDKNPSEQITKEPTTNEEVQNVPKDSSSNKVIEELISVWDLSEPETIPDEPHFHSRQDILKSFPTYDTGQDKSFHEETPNNEECSDNIRSTQRFGAQENVECLGDIGRTQEFEPEEIHNNDECSGNLGSSQRCEAQNNEVCLDDIGRTQEFEPEEIHNNEECSGNLESTQRCEAQKNEVCLDDIGKTQEFEPKLNNCVVNLGTKINGASFQAQKFNHNRSNPQRSSPKKNRKQQMELIEGLNVSHEDNNEDINTSNETVIFETSSVHEKSKCCSTSGNSNNEIPLQINKSSLTPMKQNRKKLNTSSNMESQSLAKKKRFVKETEVDISNKKKKPIEHKNSKEKSSNSLHRHDESKRRNTTKIFSSSSNDDDSYVLSSDSEDDIPKSKRVKNYTVKEDELILDYIYKHNLFSSVKGNTMWVDLEKKKLLPGRSWHGLKERFRKRILPRIHNYNVNERVIEKFERCQTAAETETKPSLKYSKEEDSLILEFIIKFRRYKEIKARSMWVCMSDWDPLKNRTWESLKNRFLKNIAPNIERYKISLEAMERITKALRKKRQPANFKKHQLPLKSRTKKSSSRQHTTSKLNYTSLSDDSSSGQSSQPSNTVSNDLSYVFDADKSSSSEDVNESVKKVKESTSRKEMLTKHSPKGSESSSRKNSQNPKKDKNAAKVAEDCESNIQENPENVLKKTTVMKRKLFTKNLIQNLYEKTPNYSGSKKDLFSGKDKKPVNNIQLQADELIGENQRSLPEEEVNAVNIHAQDEELVDENQRSPPEEEVNPVNVHSKADVLVGKNQRSPPEEVNTVSMHSQDKELIEEDQRSPPEEEVNPVNVHSKADVLVGENQRSPPEEVNTVSMHSQDKELIDEDQRSPPEEEVNTVSMHSQDEELFSENQRSPSGEVMNLLFSKKNEKKSPGIENSLNSSSGLDVSISEADVSINEAEFSNERTANEKTLNAAVKRKSPRTKRQKSVLKAKSENAIMLTTRLRRRVIKSSI